MGAGVSSSASPTRQRYQVAGNGVAVFIDAVPEEKRGRFIDPMDLMGATPGALLAPVVNQIPPPGKG